MNRAVPAAEQIDRSGEHVSETGLSLVILTRGRPVSRVLDARGAADPTTPGASDSWFQSVAGFVVALVTVFEQRGPRHDADLRGTRGVALGGSRWCSSPGIRDAEPGGVPDFGTLGALLVADRTGVIRATQNFKLGLVAATGGILCSVCELRAGFRIRAAVPASAIALLFGVVRRLNLVRRRSNC